MGVYDRGQKKIYIHENLKMSNAFHQEMPEKHAHSSYDIYVYLSMETTDLYTQT